MGIVKISEQMHENLRVASAALSRSINSQAEHWMRIGMLSELYPQLRHADICQLLIRIEQAEGFSIAAPVPGPAARRPSGGRVMARKVSIKSAADIEMARKAGALAAEVLQVVAEHVRPGVTTDELDRICHDHIVKVQQAIPANIGYHGFPKTICASPNHVICHGIPSSKVLQERRHPEHRRGRHQDGWYGDTSRMYYVGEPSPLARRLVRTTYEAMRAGIMAVKPGATLGDIGHAIQTVAHRGTSASCASTAATASARSITTSRRCCTTAVPAGPGAATRHDVHHRAHDQRRQAAPDARRLDRSHQDRSLSAQWEHGGGDRHRL